MAQTYEQLKLENQLCFPLYACAKEIVLLLRSLQAWENTQTGAAAHDRKTLPARRKLGARCPLQR